MVTKELSEAAVEFNVILSKSSLEMQNRIPERFKHFLKSIESENYKFQKDRNYISKFYLSMNKNKNSSVNYDCFSKILHKINKRLNRKSSLFIRYLKYY